MAERISIAVMSDLHFVSSDKEQKNSYVDLSTSRAEKHDPIGDFYRFIKAEKLRADILLCPGDITVAACTVGLNAAWDALQKTASELGAKKIYVATGNHDISSREGTTEPEIWERLKLLQPTYPSPGLNEMDRLHYWAEHFLVEKTDGVRFVVLNTCNTHARGVREYSHGRVTDYTIQRMMDMVPVDNEVKLNVLLCHHHPVRYPDLDQASPDYSEMAQGVRLMDALSNTGQPWLVVHGHKHFPRLSYAPGGVFSPAVLSAGSFSAVLSPVYFLTALNQFYIVDLDMTDISTMGAVGTVRAWDWIKSIGWAYSDYSANPGKISSGSGFGNRDNPYMLAASIASKVPQGGAIAWKQIEADFPSMKYMLVEDRSKMLSNLQDKFKIRAIGPSPLDPIELVRESGAV